MTLAMTHLPIIVLPPITGRSIVLGLLVGVVYAAIIVALCLHFG